MPVPRKEDDTPSKPGTLEIPKASVKRIMKLNDEVAAMSPEAVVATAKATELFLALMVQQSQEVATASNRKTIKVDDILAAIDHNQHKFEFLNEAFSK